MPVYLPSHKSRAETILALVPKRALDSGGESEEEEDKPISEDALDQQIQEFFDVIGGEPLADANENADSWFGDIPYLQEEGYDSSGPQPELLCSEFDSAQPDTSSALDRVPTPHLLSNLDTVEPQPGPSSAPASKPQYPKTQAGSKKRRRTKTRHNKRVFTVQHPTKSPAKPKKKTKFRWKKERFIAQVELPKLAPSRSSDINGTPLSYFQKFFTDELIGMIVEESNRYAIQSKGESATQLTSMDMKDFISIEISMGIIKLGGWKKYWADDTRIPRVADVMPRNKYARIRSSLHFVNNLGPINESDKYFKIRPFIEYLRQKFLAVEGLDRKFAVDEMMVAYKGKKAGARKQYMPKKPTKWGFKVYARSGTSGFIYDFFIYGGESSFNHITFTKKEKGMNFSTKCVISLCKTISDPPLSALFFDNFFSSPELISYLREEFGILSIGTLRSNRLAGAEKTLESDKLLLKRGRGSYDEVVDKKHKISIVKWADTKIVTVGSSYVGASPIGTVSRYSNVDKKRVIVQCPKIIKEYNSFMGGVDKSDMLVALYKTPLRTFKWYMAIFVHFLDLSINNAWLLYRQDHPDEKVMSLANFKLALSNSLHFHKRRLQTKTKR